VALLQRDPGQNGYDAFGDRSNVMERVALEPVEVFFGNQDTVSLNQEALEPWDTFCLRVDVGQGRGVDAVGGRFGEPVLHARGVALAPAC
jgi:hypothetical protein